MSRARHSPIPLPASPLKGICANLPISSPFKGEAGRGMGSESAEFFPIPSPTLPLKGREKCAGTLRLALMPLKGEEAVFPAFIQFPERRESLARLLP